MKQINIDIETYSNTDLTKAGVYKYADDPSFSVLLFGYSVDQGPVRCIQCAKGEEIPEEIIRALQDESVIKVAFNAMFERVCLGKYLGVYLPPDAWRCTMVASLYLGLPGSLAAVGAVLGLEKQKLTEGKELIKYFSVPCKPTKSNGGRTRNLPEHDPEKWDAFVKYNIRDVETEMGIGDKVSRFPVPDYVWQQYILDQRINDIGIEIDMTLAGQAIRCDEECRERYLKRAIELTGLENPNSPIQLKEWLIANGAQVDSLAKKEVAELLKSSSGVVKEVLKLRQLLSKSSVKKYAAMEACYCSDGRAHGLFQYYGANRTGRWAGRLIQLQNLVRNDIPDLAEARGLIRGGFFEAAEILYDSVPELLSQLIRTAFVPREGCKFIVADFSAVEARALSWMAGEKWRMDVFAQNGDIYCMSASQMFHVPVEKHGVNGHLRQRGKVAELACIAEGSLVLTHQGLVPIEHITKDHLIWDGESWVNHGGLVYRGEREVITYEGLTATADHLVWVRGKAWPIQLGLAASSGAHLVQTGDGERAIRIGEDYQYCAGKAKEETVTSVYDIRNAGQHHRFTVSGRLVHNCGYGGSVGALIAMGALDQGLTEEELKPIVDSWRAANPKIVQFWWDIDKAVVMAVKERRPTHVKCLTFRYESGFLIATLPSGRSLYYAKPRIMPNEYGRDSLTYEGIGAAKRWERIESYGPKIVENCLAAGTLVLTDRGLVPIERITDEMLIWDGEEWVTHDGLIFQGVKPVVEIDDIFMTPEHRILTEGGWIESAKASGLNWADVSLPDGYPESKEYFRWQDAMDMPLCLRQGNSSQSSTSSRQEISCEILRMYENSPSFTSEQKTWDDTPSCIRSMAFNEAKMHRPETPCLSQLRRQGDTCLRQVDGEFREFLAGYGFDLAEGSRPGPDRQQCGIFSGELPLDDQKAELPQQAEQSGDRDTFLVPSSVKSSGIDRNRRDNTSISDGSRMAGRITIHKTRFQEPVYDIRNCGPRHRFTVWNGKRFCIVSNCTQALCRDLLAEAMQRLDNAGYKIVMHVHDEVVIEAPMDADLNTVCKIMAQTPSWAEGLVLNAAGYECMFYQKD